MSNEFNTTTHATPQPRGAFIVFEGLDRSGKSTQCARLANTLTSVGMTKCIALLFVFLFYYMLLRTDAISKSHINNWHFD